MIDDGKPRLDDDYLLTFTDTQEFEYADKLSKGPPDSRDSRDILAERGDAFREHLTIAKLLQEQADGLESPSADRGYGKIYLRGYKVALRHTIDDLRNGDFLPGGHRQRDR